MITLERVVLLSSAVACLLSFAMPARIEAQPPGGSVVANGGQGPDNEQYDKLVEAERRYRELAQKGGWPAVPEGDPMKPGERYDCARLEALENRLAVEGYAGSAGATAPAASPSAAQVKQPQGAAEPGSARGGCEYGPDLVAAVKEFQKDRYLTSDGIVGGQTQRQLAKPIDDVLSKIDYALKRWRANAGTMQGSYIVVNIPAFELAVYDGRSEVLRMPVIVGLPDWQTPEMIDKIDYLVVNPSWNIPKSIANEEVIPKGKKDKGYYKREGIVFADGRLTQKPGPRNPLGRLKFMMPNSEDVYLHDTPHKSKFAAPARAFSHGCVRVEKPVELASLLLEEDPKWSRESIQAAIDARDTKTVKLTAPMPVHLLYIPAVVNGENRVKIAPDVYNKIGNASDESAMEAAPTEEDEFLGAWP